MAKQINSTVAALITIAIIVLIVVGVTAPSFWSGADLAGQVIRVAKDDTDEDKLTDFEEGLLGTDTNNADTDGDSLSDYSEVVVFNTNPLASDTDSDTISDFQELGQKSDPTDAFDTGVGAREEEREQKEEREIGEIERKEGTESKETGIRREQKESGQEHQQ